MIEMKDATLKIQDAECNDKSCPMPLEFMPSLEPAVKNVKYNKKSGLAAFEYDENKTSPEKIRRAVKKTGYKIKRWRCG